MMRPSGLNAGLSCESASSVVPGRMPWSVAISVPLVLTGTISRANQPSSVARAARRCDSTASSSSSERGISYSSAISSAPMPCPRTS